MVALPAVDIGAPERTPSPEPYPSGNGPFPCETPGSGGQNGQGAWIADHQLLQVVGRGGYGEVWLARHTRLRTLHAVKIVRRDQFGDARPFQREFEGIRRYEPISRGHANLVAILHVGGTDEFFYYVMELADALQGTKADHRTSKPARPDSRMESPSQRREFGGSAAASVSDFYRPHTLRAELRQAQLLGIDRVLEIGHALAGALAHLHQHHLVHRDVKPSNVIFVGGVPKLADLGLIASLDEARSFVGTEGYIPPEGPGTPSADCYSLGKLLYELSTGHDRNAWPEPAADLATRPDRERLLELNAILHRACAPAQADRYQSAEEMRQELACVLRQQSIRARHRRTRCWATVKRTMTALAALAVLLSGPWLAVRGLGRRYTPTTARLPSQPARGEEGPRSTNDLAQALYVKAMYLMKGDDQYGMGQVYTNFVTATQLDPNFANAYIALFEMQIRERFPGMPTNTLTQIYQLADKLKKLAPELAATQNAQSFVAWDGGRYQEAVDFCARAIRLNPNYELAHTHYGVLLSFLGRAEASYEQLRWANNLEASKAVIQTELGQRFYLHRQFTNAIEQYQIALRLQPDYRNAPYWIARAYQALGRYEEAIQQFERHDLLVGADKRQTASNYDELRRAFREGGANGYWQAQLQRTERNPESEFYRKAVIHRQLGHTNEALKFLNQSVVTAERDGESWMRPFHFLLIDEYWDGLREDPAFKAIVDKVGFNKVIIPNAHEQSPGPGPVR